MDSDPVEALQAGDRAPDLDFDGLIVDLDGVVWVGATAVPGSVAAIAEVRPGGIRLLFLTNDQSRARPQFSLRLLDQSLGPPGCPANPPRTLDHHRRQILS